MSKVLDRLSVGHHIPVVVSGRSAKTTASVAAGEAEAGVVAPPKRSTATILVSKNKAKLPLLLKIK